MTDGGEDLRTRLSVFEARKITAVVVGLVVLQVGQRSTYEVIISDARVNA